MGMKCIDQILIEWAEISPDGLQGGPFTEENISALTSVLEKRGLTRDQILEVITPMIDENWPREPKVPRKPKEPKVDKRAGDPYPEKQFEPVKISFDLQEILNQNPQISQEFIARKDSVSRVEDAVKLYNQTDQSLLTKINGIQTGEARGALGKGEIPFVWFLAGSKHGGKETGDVITSDGKKIDVKADGSTINIERNSFDNFNTIPFISDLSELIDAFRNDGVNKLATSILKSPNAEAELTSVNISSKSGRKRTRSGASVVEHTLEFINTFDMGKFGALTMAGINYIGDKVKEMAATGNTGTTVVSIFSKGEKHSAAVVNPQDVVGTIKSVEAGAPGSNDSTELDVQKIQADDPTIALSRLLKLRFFKKQWTVDMMWNDLVERLHYDGIIVVTKSGNKALEYIEKSNFSSRFSFRGIQKGISISYKGNASGQDSSSDEHMDSISPTT